MAKAPLNLLGDSFAVSHFERICSVEGLRREKRKKARRVDAWMLSID
jgi:hypothetical protein